MSAEGKAIALGSSLDLVSGHGGGWHFPPPWRPTSATHILHIQLQSLSSLGDCLQDKKLLRERAK